MAKKKGKRPVNFITKKVTKEENSKNISVAQMEELYQLYCMGNSVNKMSKLTGFTGTSISRYINQGLPTMGVKPFRERRAEMMRDIREFTHDKIELVYKDILDKMHKFFSIVGDRWLDRVQSASLLDDESLYESDNAAKLKATQAKAINPSTRDMVDILKGFKEVASLLNPPEATVVNVQQNNVSVSKEDIKGFLDTKFAENVAIDNREDLDTLIERKSLEMEE